MSIINCKWCERQIDTDFNVEHEDECELNPANVELPILEAYKNAQDYDEYVSYLEAKTGGQLSKDQKEEALLMYHELNEKYKQ